MLKLQGVKQFSLLSTFFRLCKNKFAQKCNSQFRIVSHLVPYALWFHMHSGSICTLVPYALSFHMHSRSICTLVPYALSFHMCIWNKVDFVPFACADGSILVKFNKGSQYKNHMTMQYPIMSYKESVPCTCFTPITNELTNK